MTDAGLLSRLRLDGRVALITGSDGYLGRAVSTNLRELGATVVGTDFNNHAGAAHFIAADLEREDEVRALPAKVVEQVGRLDVIVGNAAFVGTSNLGGWAVPFAEQSTETWRRAVEVNLTANFALVQAALPYLEESSAASVVFVSSIYGGLGPDWRLYEGAAMGNPAAYAASKGGLEQLTRWLSTTLAPKVRVNAVQPGGIARGQPEEFQERYCARVPLARMATEADVAAAITFLSTDASSYVTGQVLAVDGGWSAW